MSFDREGDAGTAAALEDALAEIAEARPGTLRHDRQGTTGPIKTNGASGSATTTSV